MPTKGSKFVLKRDDFQQLLNTLGKRGYRVVGPTLRDGAIVYDTVNSVADLPSGWTDEQNGGSYRLRRRDDHALFGYAVGPHSWKKFLHPPTVRLWQATRKDGHLDIREEPHENPKLAFLGVRSCELHAIAIQDRVFIHGQHVETGYKSRREQIFIVAVNCGQAGGTCFCASMNTGPKASSGFDLALTEVLDEGLHYFLVEVGTELGADVLKELPHCHAAEREQEAAQRIHERTAQQMGRKMEIVGIKELLYRNYEHPQWNNVAARCLTCANCTMVCPTVVVVDAVQSGAVPGTIHSSHANQNSLPAPIFRDSTHAFGLIEAVELSRALRELPSDFVIYGIEGENFEAGVGLSPAVQDAVSDLAKKLPRAIQTV